MIEYPIVVSCDFDNWTEHAMTCEQCRAYKTGVDWDGKKPCPVGVKLLETWWGHVFPEKEFKL